MSLTSTQIGVIGENLLINAVMKASDGRLSPFQPVADDDGLDVLFYDKQTGNAVAIQLKCRTKTTRKRGVEERGNIVHFEVRGATFNQARQAYLVAALCNEGLTEFLASWLIPMSELPEVARKASTKLVIRPSKAMNSLDRFAPYRCHTADELASRIIRICEFPMRASAFDGDEHGPGPHPEQPGV